MGSRARTIGILAALAVAGVGLYVALDAGGGRGAAPQAQVEDAPAAPVAASGELRAADAPRTEIPPAVEGREAAPEAAPTPVAGGETWIVRVVRSGAPVPGAEVTWASREMFQADSQAHAGEEPVLGLERVRRAGRSLRADAAGEARVPALAEGARVAAWEGSTIALRWVRADDRSPFVLELERDRILRVRVVDPAGTPLAGVPVGLDMMTNNVNHVAGSDTGSDGIATFAHFGLGWGLDDELTIGRAYVRGVLAVPSEAPFTLRELPVEPIELVLGAYGSVVVDVYDAAGEIADLAYDLDLDLVREHQPGARAYGTGARSSSLEGGRARFAVVGLGLELEASLEAGPQARGRTTFAGPVQAGQEVAARLTLEGAESVLLMRVLDAAGEPLRERTLDLVDLHAMKDESSLSGSDNPTTDGEGRLRYPLVNPWAEGQTLTLTVRDMPEDGRGVSEAKLDLSRAFPPGETDLGDVRLAGLPLLASGRVVDAQGKPVYVGVRVERVYGRDEHGAPRWTMAFNDPTDPEGRFSFHEPPPEGELRLRVVTSEHPAPEPIPFAPGASDLEIVLRAGGALEGAVLVPEGFPPQAIQVCVPLGRDDEQRETDVHSDGHFVVPGLEPGAVPGGVTVRLCLLSEAIELVAFDGVRVQEGEASGDPRLRAVDLRALVQRIGVSVRLPDGSPAQGGWARPVLASSAWNQPAFLIEGGRTEVLAPSGALALEINVPGYRIVRIDAARGDQEVVLEPAFAVRLELPQDVPLPGGASSLQVQLARLDASAQPESLGLYRGCRQTGYWSPSFGDESNSFDEGRALTIPIQEVGEYAVAFYVVYSQPSTGSVSFELPPAESCARLTIGAGDAGKSFRVEPEKAAYAGQLSGTR